MTPTIPEGAIAIVGMAGRFPGAGDVEAFWRNLRAGVESIARYTDEALEAEGVDPALLRHPRYVKAGAPLDEMEWFDAGFFGMSPRDAAVMDPQCRQFLECAWHALEHAGHVPERFSGSIGVFAGSGAPSYFWQNVLGDAELVRDVGFFLLRHTGNDKDFLATRVSYEFDLTGPSMNIQTACSTSLVAVHYACQSLLAFECDMALAGGVTIEQPHRHGYVYEQGEILSPDGHCRSFDHRAQGTVFGSGVGVVVLRRLEDALEAGDTIHAVIRGSAVNNDGAGKVSYLAPSVDGQAKAIAEALAISGVEAESIGFVEAHGTATPIGDPIEVAALTQAFRTQTSKRAYCALGSVKSNIGHLDTAAGVASLIKAVQAIKHGEIPPTVHFERPNPELRLESSPFFVNSTLVPWPLAGVPRRAGVSSLGVGGTNAHVILEEAPAAVPSGPSRRLQLLVLSGRSKAVVGAASRDLVEHLEATQVPLADVAYTLRTGRRGFRHRRALVCASAEEAIDILATGQGPGLVDGEARDGGREVAFLFAGGGAQHPNMGRTLYEEEPLFREIVDRCLAHVLGRHGLDLRPLLFAEPEREEWAARELQRPSLALPALLAVQYAQARLWMSWGVNPVSMIGHSMGEYTAACLAGVFSLEDALSLVYTRGKLFEKLQPGAMLSVSLGREALERYLGVELSVAAENAPGLAVASGPVQAIDALQRRLEAEGIECRRVRIDVAAHSSMLEPILGEFGAFVRTIQLSPPTITVISNLSGAPLGSDEATDPEYWVRHLRHTVRFAEGVSRLMGPNGPALLEVGPGRTLATLARLHPGIASDQPVLQSLPHPGEGDDALHFMLRTLGALWTTGVEIDWAGFDAGERRRRVPLPVYPFERQPHFIAPPRRAVSETVKAPAARVERSSDVAQWLYRASWSATASPAASGQAAGAPVLVLSEEGSPAEALAARIEAVGTRVVRVRAGSHFRAVGDDRFEVPPASPEAWQALAGELERSSLMPGIVVHAWSLRRGSSRADPAAARGEVERGFHAVVGLIQAFEAIAPAHAFRLVALTAGAVSVGVADDPGAEPLQALLLGPIRVAPKEIPTLRTRLVDVDRLAQEGPLEPALLDQLVAEIATPSDEVVVAYRGGTRYVEGFERIPPLRDSPGSGLRDGGVYLVTGGLGGLGLVAAHAIASKVRPRLALVGRTGLPPAEERSRWLAEHSAHDKISRAIREIAALEAAGAEVLVLSGDVADPAQTKSLVERVRARFGRVDGVIHAAGVLDDGPLLGRDRERSESVLAAKVYGTFALDEALAGESLDFFVVFSSISAVLGVPGQTDYTAANAFLDAFARERSRRRAGGRTLSLAWGAWRDVGMAAELAGAARYGEVLGTGAERVRPFEHPLFDARVDGAAGTTAFRTEFRLGRHWMLDEHRVRGGSWVMPGSGYVELLHAALREEGVSDGCVVRDLVFLKPFTVAENESRDLEVRLAKREGGLDVVVRGRKAGTRAWTEHARAQVDLDVREGPTVAPFASVAGRFGVEPSPPEPPHPFMDFGPRWSSLAARRSVDSEALLELALPEPFRGGVAEHVLHPALLDVATGGAQHLIPGRDAARDFYVPVGYGSIRAYAPLGHALHSHVRLREADPESGLASFDVTVYDPDGRALVQIEEFSMIRMHEGASLDADGSEEPEWLRSAITPEEGAEVLLRLFGSATDAHVLVTPRPLEEVAAEVGRQGSSGGSSTGSRRRTSPKIDVGPVERALAEHEAVAEAAALAAADRGGAVRVVAFVTFAPGRHATVSELRRFVRGRVDAALVPQNFVELPSLPRGPDGALDRSALRDPFADVDDFVAPRTPIEEAIAAIWKDLLGLDRVSVHDNFLDVGGHSLVGIRALRRMEEATGVKLHANALTLQTLGQLAADIEKAGGSVAASAAAVSAAEGGPSPAAAEPAREARDGGGFLSRIRKVLVRG